MVVEAVVVGRAVYSPPLGLGTESGERSCWQQAGVTLCMRVSKRRLLGLLIQELLNAWRISPGHLHRIRHLGFGARRPTQGEQSQREDEEEKEEEEEEEVRTEREQEPGAEAGMREEGCQAVWHFKTSMVQR
ncbi:hypothetical protein EPR50_G00061090 [Perca flavescens]|uniref:Uncharacterized protein n=1 Tax=Perca flavescens TaxID=8167 RepID=A0A484D7T6_PERFV|nr:hypothetical protein EPR50_G00061090 [Perca flavescens]